LVAKLTNIINNSFGRYFGRRFDTTVIWWLFQLQIATTNFRLLNSVTKLLFPCSESIKRVESNLIRYGIYTLILTQFLRYTHRAFTAKFRCFLALRLTWALECKRPPGRPLSLHFQVLDRRKARTKTEIIGCVIIAGIRRQSKSTDRNKIYICKYKKNTKECKIIHYKVARSQC